MPKEVLDEKAKDEFVKALQADEPVPADDASVVTTAEPEVEPAKPEPKPDDGKGPVPYERFREVNEERKQALDKTREYERELAARPYMVQQEARKILEKIAEENPELKTVIYGTEPAPVSDGEAPKTGAPRRPIIQDPRDRDIADLKAWRADEERQAMLDRISDRCEDAIDKHAVFKDPQVRRIAETVIAQALVTNPQLAANPERAVEDVASQFRAYEESMKQRYIGSKKTSAHSVPVGAGAGGGAPPGTPGKKLSLSDGSALRAFSAAMKVNSTE